MYQTLGFILSCLPVYESEPANPAKLFTIHFDLFVQLSNILPQCITYIADFEMFMTMKPNGLFHRPWPAAVTHIHPIKRGRPINFPTNWIAQPGGNIVNGLGKIKALPLLTTPVR